MSKVDILIFSTEGEESNTEINFYNGLNDHTPTILALAIGKLKSNPSTNRIIKMERKIRAAFSAAYDILGSKNLHIFFIGDGDKDKDLPSMNNSMQFVISKLNDLNLNDDYVSIYSELIFDEGKSFDHMLLQINENILSSGHKKCTNKRFFNDCGEYAGWFTDGKINTTKLKEDFKKNSKHYKIVKLL